MANKTLYIPPRDEGLWEAADRVADQRKTSLYQIVRQALDAQLPIIAAQPTPEDRWAGIGADLEAHAASRPAHSPTH